MQNLPISKMNCADSTERPLKLPEPVFHCVDIFHHQPDNKRGLTPLKNINFLNGVLFADIMVFGADAFLLHVTTTPSVAYVVRDLSDYQILRWDARGAGLFQRKYV